MLLVGYPPFEGDDREETFVRRFLSPYFDSSQANIAKHNLVFESGDWSDVSPDAIDFIKKACEPGVLP